MSVVIKGMDMPREGQVLVIDSAGRVWSKEWPTRGYFRIDTATAVPVPTPHGRLIDADALFEKIPYGDIEHDTRISRCGAIAEVCTWVLSAPTIIEAEGEDK